MLYFAYLIINDLGVATRAQGEKVMDKKTKKLVKLVKLQYFLLN